MPRTTIRPSSQELLAIRNLFIERRLSDDAHRRLRILLAWADGSTIREVAAKRDLQCSRETVRRIVRQYAKLGLPAFTNADPRPRGRTPVPKETDTAIVEDLRQALAQGRSISYRELHRKHGVSFNHVAKVARSKNLDPKNRRGRVAGTGR
jgi:transposase